MSSTLAENHHQRIVDRVTSIFLAPLGQGGRRRSGTDALKVILAVLAFAILWLGLSARVRIQVDVANLFHPPSLGLSWFVRTVWITVSIGVGLAVCLAAALGRLALAAQVTTRRHRRCIRILCFLLAASAVGGCGLEAEVVQALLTQLHPKNALQL